MVVKVGTFNVLNLARPGERYYPDEKPYSAAEYEKKAAWIVGQLGRMDADLVGFQEVFHEDALRDVCARSQQFADGTGDCLVAAHYGFWLVERRVVRVQLPHSRESLLRVALVEDARHVRAQQRCGR